LSSGLDRIQDHRNVLVLVDEHRTGPGDEGDRIGLDGCAGRGIIEVEY
jgi:hypothetical protein